MLTWTMAACGRMPMLPAIDREDDAAVDTRVATDPHDTRPTCVPGQRVLLEGSPNARDLGGTSLGENGAVACQALYRGTALTSLTSKACSEFARLGIRTVIDLRMPSERATPPEAACVVEAAQIVHAPMPIPYSLSPQDYIADLDATAQVAQAFGVFGDPKAYPVYFHCVYGRDRTGVLAAVLLLALGASPEAVMAEYKLSAEAGVGAYPASLAAVLDEIAAEGGIGAYLGRVGVTDQQLAVLRDRGIGR
jgi:protein-tyrosine phosphatase